MNKLRIVVVVLLLGVMLSWGGNIDNFYTFDQGLTVIPVWLEGRFYSHGRLRMDFMDGEQPSGDALFIFSASGVNYYPSYRTEKNYLILFDIYAIETVMENFERMIRWAETAKEHGVTDERDMGDIMIGPFVVDDKKTGAFSVYEAEISFRALMSPSVSRLRVAVEAISYIEGDDPDYEDELPRVVMQLPIDVMEKFLHYWEYEIEEDLNSYYKRKNLDNLFD